MRTTGRQAGNRGRGDRGDRLVEHHNTQVVPVVHVGEAGVLRVRVGRPGQESGTGTPARERSVGGRSRLEAGRFETCDFGNPGPIITKGTRSELS